VGSIPIARSISLDDSIAFMMAESLKIPLEMVGFGRQMDAGAQLDAASSFHAKPDWALVRFPDLPGVGKIATKRCQRRKYLAWQATRQSK
jgi:hypothetical protein